MRLIGINIPDNKRVDIGLTHLYGIGRPTAAKILDAIKIEAGKKVKSLTSDEVKKIQDYIGKNHKIGDELRQLIKTNVSRLKEIGSYRGTRHLRKLPVRGQRTKTNSRTVRGNVRKTVGSGRRKVDLK